MDIEMGILICPNCRAKIVEWGGAGKIYVRCQNCLNIYEAYSNPGAIPALKQRYRGVLSI